MDLPSMDDYLMGREKKYPLTPEILANAKKTLQVTQDLLIAFKEYRRISSGYRPAAINQQFKDAAPHSNHITCQACDLEDIDGRLNQFLKDNPQLMESLGIWCERRRGGWQHIQIVPPKSQRRWFYP